jgi:hypothetical protein
LIWRYSVARDIAHNSRTIFILIKREKFISKPVRFAYRIDTKILYSFRFIRFYTDFYNLTIRFFVV